MRLRGFVKGRQQVIFDAGREALWRYTFATSATFALSYPIEHYLMKRWLIPALFLLSGCANAAQPMQGAPKVELHGQQFSVEFANDGPSREHGLMMRTTLAPDHSMLFTFSASEPQAFWMKNTLIPLDILYFGADRRLVSMQLDVPPCKADPCPIYPSDGSAQYVLEIAAGTAKRIGVRIGDELKISGNVGTVR